LAKLPAVAHQADRALTSVTTLANNLNGLTTTLQAPNGAISKLTTTIDDVGVVATKLETEALPLTNDLRSTLREFNRTMNTVREHPQSLLFGVDRGEPGPGEAGYGATDK
jgi:phospholipid/cholesterol/gamma-HCH transport system substrate-binding protein